MSTQVIDTVNAADQLMQFASGFMISSALNAVTRLKIADLLAPGPMSAQELARQTSTNADALNRVMRMLAGVGLFEQPVNGTYGLNNISDLLRTDSPRSMHDSVNFLCDPFHLECYKDMLPTLVDGRTASEHVWNENIFDVFARTPDVQSRFDNAMTNMTKSTVAAVLEAYDFSRIGTLVDVAGGHGLLLSSVLQRYPQMKGIVFDLPHVIHGAERCLQAAGLADRCGTLAGDFFKSVPAGDAIIMKHIIHDWSDEQALCILKNCRAALKQDDGTLLLVEMLLPSDDKPHFSKVLDIEMLMLPGGRERTDEEYRDLLFKTGFEHFRVVRTESPYVVIEAK